MSYFSAITDVQSYHNPNEGRVIVNENFRKMISGVTESVNSVTGGTSSASTLSQVLTQGNTTGPNNIIVSDGQKIISSIGGGQLNLNDSAGPDGTWSLTSDNGAYTGGSAWVYGQPNNGTQLSYQISSPEAIGVGVYSSSISQPNLYTAKEILVFDNSTGGNKNSGDMDKRAVMISTRNSTFNTGVVNSVIIGGSGITASQNDTVYVSNLNINTTPSSGSSSDKILTRSSDGTIKEIDQPQFTAITISSSQILSAGTSQILLLPEPGANGYYEYKIIIEYNYGTAPYNNGGGTSIIIWDGIQVLATLFNLNGVTTNKVAIVTQNSIEYTSFTSEIPINRGVYLTTASLLNPTNGDGYFLIKIWYTIRTFG